MQRQAKSIEDAAVELLEKAIVVGECWECHLAPSIDRDGRCRHYIQVGGRDGRRLRVTRVIWAAINGQILEGLWVLHTCDNPACIRPDHLFLGTAQDNTDDMIAKGRAKLVQLEAAARRRERTAKRILPLYKQGLSRHEISIRLNIAATTIWNYTNGAYRDYFMLLARDEHTVRN